MAVVYSQNGVIVKSTGFDIIGGKKYRTVKMPDSKIWLAENLDFKFCKIGGTGKPDSANAWYYDNDETTYGWNGYKCGLMYNWYAAKVLNDNRNELCPGWHVPTNTEWNTLISSINDNTGAKLRALDGTAGNNFPNDWNGSDNFKFSILPCGYYNGSFHNGGIRGYIWTITPSTSDLSISIFISSSTITTDTDYLTTGLAIRLVRDT